MGWKEGDYGGEVRLSVHNPVFTILAITILMTNLCIHMRTYMYVCTCMYIPCLLFNFAEVWSLQHSWVAMASDDDYSKY